MTTRTQQEKYCQRFCTEKFGWNDQKRDYCRRNTACLPYLSWSEDTDKDKRIEELERWKQAAIEKLSDASELVGLLVIALAPFAALAEEYPTDSPDFPDSKKVIGVNYKNITLSDLRKAQDALSKAQEE
jgi:hypothetical protein